MAMKACRLFNRARQYSKSKEMGCLNKMRLNNFLEKDWSELTLQAEKFAREQGSPFCFPILNAGNALLNFDGKNLEEHSRGNIIKEDHVSSNNDFLNSDGKKLEERLRECKDIKFSTDFYSILEDKRLEEFRSSMPPNEIWNCVMRHLYSLTLQKVVPSEKLYMTYLIERFHNLKLENEWLSAEYWSVICLHSTLFSDLPLNFLVRTCALHMSRIPFKHAHKEGLPKELQKELLRKLEKDYKLLTSKFHDLPIISEEMMAQEINSLVIKCEGNNHRYSYATPYYGWLGVDGQSEPVFIKSKELRGTKKKLPKKIDEEMWNFRSNKAEQDAREGGSPFCFTTLADHVSTDNALSNPEWKKLEEFLRSSKDIKFNAQLGFLLSDIRFVDFYSSMTSDEIRNIIMRHLHCLVLDEVIYSEKLYMEHLINEFNHWEFVDQWCKEDYATLLEPYSEVFTMLPQCCLRRGLQLHMSRIPYKYLEKSLGKVMKNKLLRKLEEDYKLLTLKIHDFPIKSEEVMLREIECFRNNRDPGSSCYTLWYFFLDILHAAGF